MISNHCFAIPKRVGLAHPEKLIRKGKQTYTEQRVLNIQQFIYKKGSFKK